MIGEEAKPGKLGNWQIFRVGAKPSLIENLETSETLEA